VEQAVFMTNNRGTERRTPSARGPILALAALAVGATFVALPSASAGRVDPKPSVRAPRDGQRLPARPAWVKLYLGSAKLVGARLNGRQIGDDLKGRRHGRAAPCVGEPAALARGVTCKLRASPSHGLRYGKNVLRARFKRHHKVRVRRVHFRVARNRPLAAAGRDQVSVPGSRVGLNGRASLMPAAVRHRNARAGKHAALSYRWRLVHSPRGSHAKLTGARTATPSLKLGSIGRYKVRLAVTDPAGRTGTDSVTLHSENQGDQGADTAPLVGVDTMAIEGGQQGVEINTYRGDVGVPNCPHDVYSNGAFSCFYADPGQGHEWVQMLVLNRQNLSLVDNKPLYCDQATRHPQEYDFYVSNPNAAIQCVQNLANYVRTLNDNDLVIAVNQPGDGSNKQEQPPVALGAMLSGGYSNGDYTLNLGIDASGWFNAPDHGQHLPQAVRGTFSAIGVPGWKTGGLSNLSQDPGSWGAGRMQTNIAVNNLARYEPFDPAAKDETHSPMIKVLTQPRTPWPTATTGQDAAFSAIGDNVGMTSSPRAYYYTAKPTEDWAADLTAIDHLKYTDLGSSPGFTQDDFNSAQDELHKEVFWITKVNAYVNGLAMPYDGASKTLWSDFADDVSKIVSTETSNGTGAKMFAAANGIFNSLIDLIPSVGLVYGWSEKAVLAAESIISAYHTGTDLAELAGEPTDSGFEADAADLGKKLGDRLNEAETMIRVRFRNIVVADYGKLRTVALCSTSSSGCDNSQPGWNLTNNGVTNMETVLKMGLQREIFKELVPARYPLALGLTPVSEANSAKAMNDAAKWCQPVPPFEHTTGVYLWPHVDRDYWSRVYDHPPSDWAYVPVVLTAGDPGELNTWKAASWTVFGRMFDPIDPSGDFNKGGLAIDETKFIADAYNPKDPPYSSTDHFLPHLETSLSNCRRWEWGL
jgi:hypothetical protein